MIDTNDNSCRIFLCYRDNGAETAKLFYDSLRNIQDIEYGKVWFSDYEGKGNYVLDLQRLLSEADYVVLFLAENFTKGFLRDDGSTNISDGQSNDSVTVREIIEIEKQRQERSIEVLCVNINGNYLNEYELNTLKQVFVNEECFRSDSLQFFKNLQRNEYNRRQTKMETFIRTRFKCLEMSPKAEMLSYTRDQALFQYIEERFNAAKKRLGDYSQAQKYIPDLAPRFKKEENYFLNERDELQIDKKSGKAVLLSYLIQPQQPCRIAITGEGGIGKTTTMLEYAEHELKTKPVIYVHLSDVIFGEGDSATQLNSIQQYIREKICANAQIWNKIFEWAKLTQANINRMILLIDGLNELTNAAQKIALKNLSEIAQGWPGAHVIVSARNPEMLKTKDMESFEIYQAIAPAENTIKAVLQQKHIDDQYLQDAKLIKLLCNPLRLYLFIQAQSFFQTVTQDRQVKGLEKLLHDGTTPNTVGKLMDTFLASQLYHYFQSCGMSEEDMPQITAIILGEVIIPWIGWKMYRENRFSVSESELRALLKNVPGDFSDVWAYYKNRFIDDLTWDYEYSSDYIWSSKKAYFILEKINLIQHVTDDNNESVYVFPHQMMRDYYAASFLALLQHSFSAIHAGQLLAKDWMQEALLSDDVISLVSEILEEEKAMPICEPSNGWLLPGKKADSQAPSAYSAIEKNLGLYRGRSGEDIQTAIWNMLRILKYARQGMLAGGDFSGLDLRKCNLKDIEFSLWHREQLIVSSFDQAIIDQTCFFGKYHHNLVTAVCPIGAKTILSGDMDGVILKTDISTMNVLGKWVLGKKKVKGIVWEQAIQKAAAFSDHQITVLNMVEARLEAPLTVEDGYIQQVRFSQNGKVEYSFDTMPLRWIAEDGSCLRDTYPSWMSGAYAINKNGQKYWRSSMYKNIYVGEKKENGEWIENGGRLYDFYQSNHLFNCAYLYKGLKAFFDDLPITKNKQNRNNRIFAKTMWAHIRSDSAIDEIRDQIFDYLHTQAKNSDKEFQLKWRQLRKRIEELLAESPERYCGNRISCIDVRDDEERIVVTCGLTLFELQTEPLRIVNSVVLPRTISSAKYFPSSKEEEYLVVSSGSEIVILEKDLSIAKVFQGDMPTEKRYQKREKDGSTYLLCTDGGLRRLDEKHRVSRKRKILLYEMSKTYVDPVTNEFHIAYPLATKQWQSGERYTYDTNQYDFLTSQYYQAGEMAISYRPSDEQPKEKVYYLNDGIQVIHADDPNHPIFTEYSRDLFIFGCSFRNVKGNMTKEDWAKIYMDGGIIDG